MITAKKIKNIGLKPFTITIGKSITTIQILIKTLLGLNKYNKVVKQSFSARMICIADDQHSCIIPCKGNKFDTCYIFSPMLHILLHFCSKPPHMA